MTDTLSNFEENCKPIFQFSPRTLVELSSFKVAMNIWLQEFREFYPPENTSCIDLFEMDVNSENLSRIPRKIRKIIDAWFYPLSIELDRWISYSKRVSGNFSYHRFYTRFDLVVFGSDCRVHFKNTVMNFLEDGSLDNVTKFEMACVYCVEEKIDSLWPLVSYTLSIDYLLFDNNFMLYYWICRKKNELNRIPLQEFGRIEFLMIDMCRSNRNLSAVQYFLSLLDRNDRLQQINQFLESRDRFEFVTRLLPFFDAPIQLHVVNKYSTNTLAAFVEDDDSFDQVIQVWLHIKDRLIGEQFCHDVIQTIIRRFDSVYYNKIGNRIRNTYVESILTEIWRSSPEHLKQFIFNFHFEDVLYDLAYYKEYYLKNFGRDISFLLDILLDADIDLRKKFWDENWSEWIAGVPTAQLDRLMALCLVESGSIDSFKRQLKETNAFTKYCNRLIKRQYSSELNEFLCYLYPDQEVRNNIKVKLLNHNGHWKNIIFNSVYVKHIQKYGEFVDNLFTDDILAQNFKNQFILSEENFHHLCDALVKNRFSCVECIVETFASSDKRVELKEILLNMFRDNLMNGRLYGFHEFDTDCGIFLTWCVDDDVQRMKCFMKSLPIDEIFEAALSNCLKFNPIKIYEIDGFKKVCKFEYLNKFLLWYFESIELCENFVRGKIEYYREMPEKDVESIFGMDKWCVVERMKEKWICDGELCIQILQQNIPFLNLF